MRGILERVKRLVFGSPIASDSAQPAVFRTRLALPVFGAGIVSAAAYAPDAVVDALRRGGQQGAIPWMAGGVVLIMLLLGLAYRSNVRERPDARADYGLVRDRLGNNAGVVTGAALLVDYLFTVAVSVAAIGHMISFMWTSAVGYEPLLGVSVIAVMTLASLRGIRDRARVLLGVWFGFLLVVGLMLVFGLTRAAESVAAPIGANAPTTWGVVVAWAGAIASGAVMVTGIEHLASAGPNHAEPRGRRAGRTLVLAVLAAALAFFAIAWLAWKYRISGWANGPIILQVGDAVFARHFTLWLVAAAAVAILYAAAQAVFRRFSNLSSLLARDSYLPRQLSMLSDRLVFRGGVLLVAAASGVLVIAARADLETLIHMYVIGVFTSIVLSQVAMVRHFTAKIALEKRSAERNRMLATRMLHAIAAGVASAVWIVVAVFNFVNGAWIAIVLIAALVVLMHAINRHYAAVRRDLQIAPGDRSGARPSATHAIVLVAQLHRPAMRALAYAKAARHSTLEAVGVQIERAAAEDLQRRWGQSELGVPLVILDSPYRDLAGPVIDYVRTIHRANPREIVVVYVPEYVVGRWWERFLHNKATARLRQQLMQIPGVVVSAVPYHLESARGDSVDDQVDGADVDAGAAGA